MHEWALAETVVKHVTKLAQEKKIQKVKEIVLKVGEIQYIDLDVFKQALMEVSNGTPMEEASIRYEIEEAVIKCNVCGHRWKYKESFEKLKEDEREAIHFIPESAHVFIKCPSCSSPDFEVVEGRGIYIVEVI